MHLSPLHLTVSCTLRDSDLFCSRLLHNRVTSISIWFIYIVPNHNKIHLKALQRRVYDLTELWEKPNKSYLTSICQTTQSRHWRFSKAVTHFSAERYTIRSPNRGFFCVTLSGLVVRIHTWQQTVILEHDGMFFFFFFCKYSSTTPDCTTETFCTSLRGGHINAAPSTPSPNCGEAAGCNYYSCSIH